MANNFIAVDCSVKRLANELQQSANMLAAFLQKFDRINEIMQNMNPGDNDYTVIEREFGLPAGKGGDVLYLVANAKAALDGAGTVQQFATWLAGI